MAKELAFVVVLYVLLVVGTSGRRIREFEDDDLWEKREMDAGRRIREFEDDNMWEKREMDAYNRYRERLWKKREMNAYRNFLAKLKRDARHRRRDEYAMNGNFEKSKRTRTIKQETFNIPKKETEKKKKKPEIIHGIIPQRLVFPPTEEFPSFVPMNA